MEENNFIQNLRNSKKAIDDEAEERSKVINDWDEISTSFMNAYNDYLSEGGRKKMATDTGREKLRNFIGKAGVADGKWTQEQYDNAEYDELEFQRYGTQLIKDLVGEDGLEDFGTYVSKHGTKEQQEYYKRATRNMSDSEKAARGLGGAAALGGLALLGPLGWLGGVVGFGIGANQDKKRKEALEDLQNKYLESHKKAVTSAFDLYENADEYLKNRPQGAQAGTGTGTGTGTGAGDDEYVEFRLNRGNDPNYRGFGQKILDLGINTDNGLWGENGDVAYYTKQLNDQGIYGNLPINQTIRLKRRK